MCKTGVVCEQVWFAIHFGPWSVPEFEVDGVVPLEQVAEAVEEG